MSLNGQGHTSPKLKRDKPNQAHLRLDPNDHNDDDDTPTSDGEDGEESARAGDCGEDSSHEINSGSAPTQLRWSTRTTPRPLSYADPYTLRF